MSFGMDWVVTVFCCWPRALVLKKQHKRNPANAPELNAHGPWADKESSGTSALEQRGQVLCNPGRNSLLEHTGGV